MIIHYYGTKPLSITTAHYAYFIHDILTNVQVYKYCNNRYCILRIYTVPDQIRKIPMTWQTYTPKPPRKKEILKILVTSQSPTSHWKILWITWIYNKIQRQHNLIVWPIIYIYATVLWFLFTQKHTQAAVSWSKDNNILEQREPFFHQHFSKEWPWA